MVLKAQELLYISQNSSDDDGSTTTKKVDVISEGILSLICVLDDWGARTVNLFGLGVAAFVFFWFIRVWFGKSWGVDWYALLHALLSGGGAVLASYLDLYASEALTGTPEPLRSCQCQGPFTSLHRIIPAITMGYSIFDFLDGLTISIDFAMHGAAMIFVTALYAYADATHLITCALVSEMSTIHLNLIRAEFLPKPLFILNQLLFVISFFVFRLVICPYLWVQLMTAFYVAHDQPTYCFSPILFPVAGLLGTFFNCLNVYWFYKILLKMKRKLSGTEAFQDRNKLNELSQQQQATKASSSAATTSSAKPKTQ